MRRQGDHTELDGAPRRRRSAAAQRSRGERRHRARDVRSFVMMPLRLTAAGISSSTSCAAARHVGGEGKTRTRRETAGDGRTRERRQTPPGTRALRRTDFRRRFCIELWLFRRQVVLERPLCARGPPCRGLASRGLLGPRRGLRHRKREAPPRSFSFGSFSRNLREKGPVAERRERPTKLSRRTQATVYLRARRLLRARAPSGRVESGERQGGGRPSVPHRHRRPFPSDPSAFPPPLPKPSPRWALGAASCARRAPCPRQNRGVAAPERKTPETVPNARSLHAAPVAANEWTARAHAPAPRS